MNQEKIHVFHDPCHMEKLIRNTLARKKVIIDDNNNKIEWKYIVSLYDHTKNDSTRCHKITKKHIQWQQNIMNVRIAVETMSESVASYMEYLMKQNHPDFVGAAPTIRFIRFMNRLFDVFNSKKKNHSDLFKRSLNSDNSRVIFDFFDTAVEYLKSLKVEETRKLKRKRQEVQFKKTIVPLVQSKSKTGARVEDTGVIDSIPTYYLLQDVVEIFFAKIRAFGGYNNNPNVHQFSEVPTESCCLTSK